MWNPMLTTLHAWNVECGTTIAKLTSEWSGFLWRRLGEDMVLPQSLAACTSPVEMWQTYVDFLQRMASDYQKEMSVMAELGTRAAKDSPKATGQRSSKTNYDVAAAAH
jgi:hypothetical protein